ncbi:MAG: GNAT family N-acetyltransferase [bacterium]
MLSIQSSVTLREAGEADLKFLYQVYASTRAEEMAATGWSAAQAEAFLREQFRLQDTHYRKHYPGALFQVVLVDREPAGRLYEYADGKSVRVMDIALLPSFQRRGIGGILLRSLMDRADAGGWLLNLHVEFNNPIRDWYLRLGFKESPGDGVYVFMERPALAGVKV